MLASVGLEQGDPVLVQASAAAAQTVPEMFAHTVRNQKSGILMPAVAAFGEATLLLAKRLAMGCTGVLLVGSPIADMAVDNDQGRHVLSTLKALERLRQ